MKYIDLFAGIGGFHYGIDRCNRRVAETSDNKKGQHKSNHNSSNGSGRRSDTYTCVYSNEWDKYANSVYRKHFGECDSRDIRTVDARTLPDFDLLCGGFPCQSFSIAGKRRGFDDTRGTLFFDIARILREKRPRLCLLENVKGLLSHDEGRTIKTIFATLDELGYDLQWQVLNSKDFGVPQNRERIFIIGHLRGTPRPEVFPLGQDGGLDNKTLNTKTKEVQSYRCLEATEYKGVSSERFDGIYKDMKIRRLTPIECERLQGFPDNWTQYGADGELISDTQRYKMCGNAVTTNVITEIAKRLV